MSSRPKAFLKQAKAKKKKEQILDDADDYLAAAVENEDAMGKHRAGDPLKSLRFARRAIELYQEGLAKWPRNLDLAYNKARLELEIATHPLLAKHLDVPVIDVLYESLNSHQYALSLDHDNADALFNIAQVLTSIAEHIAKDNSLSDTEALSFLEQALQYQSRCLSLQEGKYAETRGMYREASGGSSEADDDDDGGAMVDANTTSIYEEQEQAEQWVSVVEPVTANTLVDTILSQLSTLTTLCSVLSTSRDWIGPASNATMASSPVSLSGIEACSAKANEMLQAIMRTENIASRTHEIALTKAILAGNLLELAYRSKAIGIDVYKTELDKAFTAQELDSAAPDAQIAYARTLLALNAAATDSDTGVPPGPEIEDFASGSLGGEIQDFANLRWNALSKAQKVLTSAASLPTTKADTEALATTHMLRGDTSLLLLALAYPPTSFSLAATNANQLLKNAEVFYRNAHKLFGTLDGDGHDERDVAGLREALVLILQKTNGANTSQESTQGGARDVLRSATQSRKDDWRNEQLQDMIDEGLVRPEALRML